MNTITINKKVLLITGCLAAVLTLAACQPEGNAEKAGKKIDKVVANSELQMDKTAKKVEEKIEVAKDTVVDKAEIASDYLDDSVITTQVKTAILNDATLKVTQIEVITTSGVVTLSGAVDSQQIIDRAIDVAKAQKQVISVRTDLRIAPLVLSK